jgi:hypothetical protein
MSFGRSVPGMMPGMGGSRNLADAEGDNASRSPNTKKRRVQAIRDVTTAITPTTKCMPRMVGVDFGEVEMSLEIDSRS